MPAASRCALLAVCAVLMTVHFVNAENQPFAGLLAQAKAQAAAGHRWEPPGDNAAETIMRMIDLIPTATPAQLSELSALIESGRPGPLPTASKADPITEDRPPPAPPASQPPASTAIVAPASPPALAAHPGPERPGQVALGEVAPNPNTPSAVMPSAVTPGPITPSSITPKPVVPSPVVPNPVVPSPGVPNPVVPNPVVPSPVTHGPLAPGQAIPDAGSRAAVLFARGLDAELHGDFSGARRFYSSAAQQGDAAAARHLGRLYDPAYLKQTALGGVDPDPVLARQWYERAVRLGDAEAGPLLAALSLR
jgi:hypothetical protein